MPRSAWMSFMCTGWPGFGVKHLRAKSSTVGTEPSFGITPSNLFGLSYATGLPSQSSRLPSRSILNTAR